MRYKHKTNLYFLIWLFMPIPLKRQKALFGGTADIGVMGASVIRDKVEELSPFPKINKFDFRQFLTLRADFIL